MATDNLIKALNQQINKELESYYIYLAMAADFEDKNLPGFAHWMEKQAQEEMMHAMKIYKYINDVSGRVLLKAIPEPPAKYETPLSIFEAALAHEKKITASINALMDLAIKENDHATKNFLAWFIDEQVEEEASADEIVQKLKMIGDKGHAVYMLDKELGSR